MSNENDNGGPMFGRQAGVSEQVQVNTLTQIKIPVLRMLTIWFLYSCIPFVLYIGLKYFITNQRDWSLLIYLVTAVIIIALLFHLSNNPVLFVRRYQYDLRRLIPKTRPGFLIACGIALGVLASEAYMYIEWVVPYLAYTLDLKAHIVALLCAVLGLLLAAPKLIGHHVDNLGQSLYDSDYHALDTRTRTAWEIAQYLDDNDRIDDYPVVKEKIVGSYPLPIIDQAAREMRNRRALGQVEQAPAQAPKTDGLSNGVVGYSKHADKDIFVSRDKVINFITMIDKGLRTTTRSEWVNRGLTRDEYDALIDRFGDGPNSLDWIAENKMLRLPGIEALRSLKLIPPAPDSGAGKVDSNASDPPDPSPPRPDPEEKKP